MIGFQTFHDYIFLKTHFSDRCNFVWSPEFESKKLKEEAFLKRTDVKIFKAFEKAIGDRKKIYEILISAFLVDPSIWIGDITRHEKIPDYHKKRMKTIGALFSIFEQDCLQLSFIMNERNKTFAELLLTTDQKKPIIYSLIDRYISFETVCVISLFNEFLGHWSPLNPIEQERKNKTIKYAKLLVINNPDRFLSTLCELCEMQHATGEK